VPVKPDPDHATQEEAAFFFRQSMTPLLNTAMQGPWEKLPGSADDRLWPEGE
jgi:hypothetical protein